MKNAKTTARMTEQEKQITPLAGEMAPGNALQEMRVLGAKVAMGIDLKSIQLSLDSKAQG